MTIAINVIIVIMIMVPLMSVADPVADGDQDNRQRGQDSEYHQDSLLILMAPAIISVTITAQ
jgi:hypothetical protein